MRELLEKLLLISESEKHIRAIYKVYKDHERKLEPEESDLDLALEGMEHYYKEYIDWWKSGHGGREPRKLQQAYVKRLGEITSALRSRSVQDKIIALDNAINQWHMDFPVIRHLMMDMGEEDAEKEIELEDILGDVHEILRRLGRLPEESPYSRV